MNDCPKCDTGNLVTSIDGSSMTSTCDTCGWSVATSFIDPIFLDENTYEIILESNNRANKETLAAVSKAAGCNYIEAKKIVDNPDGAIARGDAVEMRAIARTLVQGGVSFRIVPDFPHEL